MGAHFPCDPGASACVSSSTHPADSPWPTLHADVICAMRAAGSPRSGGDWIGQMECAPELRGIREDSGTRRSLGIPVRNGPRAEAGQPSFSQ